MIRSGRYTIYQRLGVPIRLEVGPRDLANNEVLAVVRYSGEKRPISIKSLSTDINSLLEEIHAGMYKK